MTCQALHIHGSAIVHPYGHMDIFHENISCIVPAPVIKERAFAFNGRALVIRGLATLMQKPAFSLSHPALARDHMALNLIAGTLSIIHIAPAIIHPAFCIIHAVPGIIRPGFPIIDGALTCPFRILDTAGPAYAFTFTEGPKSAPSIDRAQNPTMC